MLLGLPGSAAAATYTLPGGFGSAPFGICTWSSGTATATCAGNIAVGNNDTVNFDADMTVNISGNFTVGNSSVLANTGGYNVSIVTGGSISIGNTLSSDINFTAGGSVVVGNNGTINGNVTAGGSIGLGSGTVVNGSCSPTNAQCTNQCTSSTSGSITTVTCTGNGFFKAPAGVTLALVEAWGGGGGGGAATGNPDKGGGGAGGQYAYKPVTVVPGTTYPVVVGTGGAGGSSSAGSAGGDSSFNTNTVVAKGGAGGGYAGSNGGDGAAGTGSTTGGIGETVYSGGSGVAGSSSSACNNGGAGGGGAGSSGNGGDASGNTAGTGTATGGGNGGAGSNSSGNGASGSTYGGGGAGACREGGGSRTGGSGGAGLVVITYSTGTPTILADWRMDEASWNGTANEVLDSSGNNNHGRARIAAGSTPLPTTASGSPAYTVSGNSTCSYGQFDGVSETTRTYTYVELSNMPALPTSFTFTAWIRSTNPTAQHQRILVRDDADNGWGLSLADGTGQAKLRFFNRNITNSGTVTGQGSNPGCGVFCLDTNQVVTANNWHYIAAAIDTVGKTVTLYVYSSTGALLAKTSSPFSGTWADGTGTAAIGGETSASSEGRQTSWHFLGNIDEVQIYSGVLAQATIQTLLPRVRACPSTVDHVEFVHDGAALTCTPKAISVLGCNTAATCYNNAGNQSSSTLSVNLPAISGATWCSNSSCSSTLSGLQSITGGSALYLRNTSAGTISLSGGTAAGVGNTTVQCYNSATSSGPATNAAACNLTYASTGLLFDVPDHVSEVSQTVNVSAVRSSDNATVCVPAFQSVSKNVNFKCSYTNPSSGFVPVRVGGTALNADNNSASTCDGTGQSVSLTFNASGVASTTFQYADVGQMGLTATYTGSGGDAGLTMTGTDSFRAAPKDFVFSSITSGPIGAGHPFSATVTARNNANATTRNFGKESSPESVTLALGSRVAPTGTDDCTNGPCDGVVIGTVGSWNNGQASTSNAAWSEVGQMTLKATLASGSYLGSGLTATGTSATIGDFVPAYFDTTVTRGCVAGAFTYSGQPFTVKATAKNASGGTTVNYSNLMGCSVCSKLVTLYDPSATTNFNGTNTLAASAFAKGEASRSTVAYTFPNALTAPTTITLRAIDATVTPNVSSSGHTEGTSAIRSGRLRLANAYGSAKANLALPVQADYWSGSSWVINSADSCTTVPASAFSLVSPPAGVAVSGAVSLAAGAGTLTLTPPAGGASGSVDLAANLGALGNDNSCLATHGGTAANLPWLRSRNGTCATTFDRDPSARASFGVYSPESQRSVHVRETF